MTRFDESTAECLVFTFKEGLLSAVAHDLKIRVGRFELSRDGAAVNATFDAASLQVICARASGADAPNLLSDSDKRSIERNIAKDVLESARHPQIRFEGKATDSGEVSGTLYLHGVARELRTQAQRVGDCWLARVSLHQPDFGIRPYRAMLGTLRVRPDVEVQVSIPAG